MGNVGILRGTKTATNKAPKLFDFGPILWEYSIYGALKGFLRKRPNKGEQHMFNCGGGGVKGMEHTSQCCPPVMCFFVSVFCFFLLLLMSLVPVFQVVAK